jgi:uncharacterized membrane-anchored protein
MTETRNAALSKVPQVTIAFWIIKICATTLGETGGDQLSMTMGLGYAESTGILFALFLMAVGGQIAARRYMPWLYWLAILATTMVGTTMSDFLDRSAGLGYIGGSAVLIAALLSVLAAWRLSLGSITFDHVVNPKVEAFYWITILFSSTLGTALGDFAADDAGLGFGGGALLFGGSIAVIALAYFLTSISRTLLFWAAFVLTRPLGATLGDLLTKPHDHGGLALGTLSASLVLAVAVVILVFVGSPKSALAKPA